MREIERGRITRTQIGKRESKNALAVVVDDARNTPRMKDAS